MVNMGSVNSMIPFADINSLDSFSFGSSSSFEKSSWNFTPKIDSEPTATSAPLSREQECEDNRSDVHHKEAKAIKAEDVIESDTLQKFSDPPVEQTEEINLRKTDLIPTPESEASAANLKERYAQILRELDSFGEEVPFIAERIRQLVRENEFLKKEREDLQQTLQKIYSISSSSFFVNFAIFKKSAERVQELEDDRQKLMQICDNYQSIMQLTTTYMKALEALVCQRNQEVSELSKQLIEKEYSVLIHLDLERRWVDAIQNLTASQEAIATSQNNNSVLKREFPAVEHLMSHQGGSNFFEFQPYPTLAVATVEAATALAANSLAGSTGNHASENDVFVANPPIYHKEIRSEVSLEQSLTPAQVNSEYAPAFDSAEQRGRKRYVEDENPPSKYLAQ
jgi:hypothetical protein